MRIIGKVRASIGVGLALSTPAGCHSPTAPAKSVRVRTIRYERVYPPAGPGSGTMWIEMSIPIAGEQSGRSNIPICFPQPSSDGAFVCDSVNWDVPVDDDAWVNVNDVAVGRLVATNVFVNGQRVTRVRAAGVTEIGDFRVDATGRVY
jgi:hypothetical protein